MRKIFLQKQGEDCGENRSVKKAREDFRRNYLRVFVKKSLMSTRFYFIRHGQTDWNVEHRFMGHTDIPLNEVGLEQAHQAAIRLAGIPIQCIYTSPLRRALKTAEVINQKLRVPLESLERLKEANLGIKEGEVQNDIFNITTWESGTTPAKAESYVDFRTRVLKTFQDLLVSINDLVLVVAHGGVFRALTDSLQCNSWLLENAKPVYFNQKPSGDWEVFYLS